MTKVREILDYCDTLAPLNTAEEWDNVGLLVGDFNKEVTKALLALDITDEVLDDAKEKGAQLIISHHPVIFSGLKELHPDQTSFNMVTSGLAAICLHTNLDKADLGVNTFLAKKLDLNITIKNLDNYLIVGNLDKEYTSDEFAQYIKEKLGLKGIRYTRGRNIKKVCISSGGGGEAIFSYFKYRFDAFISGEIKYHQFIFSKEHNLSAYDAGHFNTETVVLEPLKRILSDQFPNIEFIISDQNIDPITFA